MKIMNILLLPIFQMILIYSKKNFIYQSLLNSLYDQKADDKKGQSQGQFQGQHVDSYNGLGLIV